jgi:hypothetical protein
MSTSFEKYSDILLDAFQSNLRSDDLATKKAEIISELVNHYGVNVEKVLFVGFSPGILKLSDTKLFVTEVSDTTVQYLADNNCPVTYIPFNDIINHRFTMVVAVDEYLTFAESDNVQRERVDLIARITERLFVTTLRDYKNQDFKDREFSQPIAVRRGSDKKIYFEHYEYSSLDRNSYEGTNYIIDQEGVAVAGPFPRRSMFFKQLAKFSFDAGAKNFLVHQNLMHKSVIKKNYEHIITITF